MVLSNAQKAELHKSILGYMKKNGFEESFEVFRKATGNLEVESKHEVMLETKWRSIVRLQKKIFQLESANRQLTEDLQSVGKGKKLDASMALPREPQKHTLTGHRAPITAVVFHPVYNVVASASEDATIKIWDYESGKFERSLQGHQDAVQDVAFNQSGTLLASCSADLSIKIWNFETYECTKTLNGHDHNVSSVCFVPSGDYVVSASRDKNIKLWEIASGYCVRTYSGHDAWVRRVQVSPDGILIASASMDQSVRTWNLKTGESVRICRDHDHVVETLCFSNAKADTYITRMLAEEKTGASTTEIALAQAQAKKDGKDGKDEKQKEDLGGAFLISGSRDRTIKIWQVNTGVCVKTFQGHDNWVRQVLIHPSGRFIVSCGDDKTIRVWDLAAKGRNISKIENAHKSFVSSIDWNKSFPLLASGAMDNTVQLWECR